MKDDNENNCNLEFIKLIDKNDISETSVESEITINNIETKPKPKVRKSNIELLRILSILIIVASHFAYHGDYDFNYKELTTNRFWVKFLLVGGKIGVNTFIFISGYFLVNSKGIKVFKVIKLLLQMLTYSLAAYAFGRYLKLGNFDAHVLKLHLFPFSFEHWWFASTYLMLYILSPYINVFICSLNQKSHKNFLITIAFFWCVLPTLTEQKYNMNNLLWFIYIYCFAGYIKKYSLCKNFSSVKCLILSILGYLSIYIYTVLFDLFIYYFVKNNEYSKYSGYFYKMNSIPSLVTSLFLFLAFTKMNFTSRFINFVAATTFGIYLIQSANFVSHYIWKNIFKTHSYKKSNKLIPYSIYVTLILFIVGSIIETIRIYTIEKLYIKLILIISEKLERLIKKIQNIFD